MQSAVFNYSWKKFPYIWNEIPFHVDYESDLEYVAGKIRELVNAEPGDKMAKDVDLVKEYFKETAIPGP